MFVDIHYPTQITPKALDEYLEKGWFRLGQGIFTTNFLKFDNQFYSALWIRIALSNFELSKTQQKLFKQNAHFTVKVRKAKITGGKEILFERYKESIAFETAESLHKLLYGKSKSCIFNTFEVSVYDGRTLIACGFFDMGEKSAEGIVCFYHPNYKKYSLGKYLMLLKMQHCQRKKLDYFYPGYYVPKYKRFDYKLDLCKTATTFLDVRTNAWRSMDDFVPEQTPINIIEQKLRQLVQVLDDEGLHCTPVYYDFYDINMAEGFVGDELLDTPMMIFCFETLLDEVGIFVYDIFSEKYHFMICQCEYEINEPVILEGYFTQYVLKSKEVVLSNSSATQIGKEYKQIVG